MKVNDPVRMVLENVQINRGVVDLLKEIDPVAYALNIVQDCGTSLGMSVMLWIELLERLKGIALFGLQVFIGFF